LPCSRVADAYMGGEETQPIVHRGSYGVVCVSCVVVVWVGGYVYVGGGGGGWGWVS